MRQFYSTVNRFIRDETGANALEYALVMILVAFAIVGGAGLLGTNLNTLFSSMGANVKAVQVPSL
jgi:pilus assembly protein Flp/PilA